MSNIILNIQDSQGYSADQVSDTITITELIEALEAAREEHGDEARVILRGTGHGAVYGGINAWSDIVSADESDDESEGSDW